MRTPNAPVPVDHIARAILVLRGQRVILDRDLAALYGVTTKRFNEQVKRNAARFPEDFMFQVTAEEAAVLRSQIATSKHRRKTAAAARVTARSPCDISDGNALTERGREQRLQPRTKDRQRCASKAAVSLQ